MRDASAAGGGLIYCTLAPDFPFLFTDFDLLHLINKQPVEH